jgi:hypothetical protein
MASRFVYDRMLSLTYKDNMPRRGLCVLVALAIALVGYQPSLGISATPAQMLVSKDGDCQKKTAADCCDESGKDKRLCLFSDACVMRHHVNAGLEALSFEPIVRLARGESLSVVNLRSRHRSRAGPLFRPPII